MLPFPLLVFLGFFVKESNHISLGNITSGNAIPSNCSCKRGGRIINLESLQSTEPRKPRFSVVKSGYTYSYNPCYPFVLGHIGPDSNCQKDVALCKSVEAIHFYRTLGTQTSESCDLTASEPRLVYHHTSQGDYEWRKSYVILHCDPVRTSVNDALFQVINENTWTFNLTHSACCWTTTTPSPSSSSSVEPVTMVTHKTTSTSPDDGSVTLEVSVSAGASFITLFVIGLLIWWRRKWNAANRQRRGLLAEVEVVGANAEPQGSSLGPGKNVSRGQNLPSPYQSFNNFFDIKNDKTEYNMSPDRDVNKSPA